MGKCRSLCLALSPEIRRLYGYVENLRIWLASRIRADHDESETKERGMLPGGGGNWGGLSVRTSDIVVTNSTMFDIV